MKHALLAATVLLGFSVPYAASAAPSCTGTTQTVASGGIVPAAFLLTSGNCVSAGDKVFGDFSVTNAGAGNASFIFGSPFGNVTLGFSGVFNPSTTATLHYQVAVDPTAIALGWRIDDLTKDFTLNPAAAGFASATLVGTTTPATNPPIAINCTRTANPAGGDCPETADFAPVLALAIDETLTTDANAVATGLTDTISQINVVPEPASIALMGVGLLCLGMVRLRHRG